MSISETVEEIGGVVTELEDMTSENLQTYVPPDIVRIQNGGSQHHKTAIAPLQDHSGKDC